MTPELLLEEVRQARVLYRKSLEDLRIAGEIVVDYQHSEGAFALGEARTRHASASERYFAANEAWIKFLREQP